MSESDVLINRQNWHDTREYLTYCEEVLQNHKRSVALTRVAMDHLLNWAGNVSFSRVHEIRPVLQRHLDVPGRSPDYLGKLLSIQRTYFRWARDRWPNRYARTRGDWIATLRTKRRLGYVKEREVFDLDQLCALVDFKPRTRIERRERAMAAALFLSGMRAGAFVSLPVRSVTLDYQLPDLDQTLIMIRQWPDWGVDTKNHKPANTYMLPHPELQDLREIVREWHQEVLDAVGPYGMWWALIEPDGERFCEDQTPGENRRNGLEKRLEWLCERVGVPYLSPHKLRHGHITWAEQKCRSAAEFKAISQNVMHGTMRMTDSEYSDLTDDGLARQLALMGARDLTLSGDEKVFLQAAIMLLRKSGVDVMELLGL